MMMMTMMAFFSAAWPGLFQLDVTEWIQFRVVATVYRCLHNLASNNNDDDDDYNSIKASEHRVR